MNTYRYVILISLVIVLSCVREERKDTSEDVQRITQMSKARAKAFNEGNAKEIAVHFTKNAYLMAPDKKVQAGRAAVEKYYQSIFDEYETVLESYYEEVEVDGDLAYGRGEAKVTLISKVSGDTTYSSAKYLNILQRQPDGRWRTTHDIWNGN